MLLGSDTVRSEVLQHRSAQSYSDADFHTGRAASCSGAKSPRATAGREREETGKLSVPLNAVPLGTVRGLGPCACRTARTPVTGAKHLGERVV